MIVLNAGFAFIQELQAERAVEALAAYLPTHARVMRDGQKVEVEARTLVPGDVLLIEEGDRICADARMIDGDIEVDLSTLTGESLPASRSADQVGHRRDRVLHEREPRVQRHGLHRWRGASGGHPHRNALRTGSNRCALRAGDSGGEPPRTTGEAGRLAHRNRRRRSRGLRFSPWAWLAGLSIAAAASFSIGLLVANVPEGLLPTITLALAVGVRDLARRGAVVKRLSAVETLGSTTVICTDKTGTLTQNRMRVTKIWTMGGDLLIETRRETTHRLHGHRRAVARCAAQSTTALLAEGSIGTQWETQPSSHCSNWHRTCRSVSADTIGMLADSRSSTSTPALKRMSTVNPEDGNDIVTVNTKGAPETVLPSAARSSEAMTR